MYTNVIELTIDFDSFEDAVEKVIAALSAEKFGIVSDVNVQGIFKKKMDHEIPGYRILGACMAPLARRVIEADPDAGALLPCNVVVRETEEQRVFVSLMSAQAVLALAENEAISQVAQEVDAMLEKLTPYFSA
ncbi:DUF302 domain-containing protein [Candidatus Venteria ishoeyi]|uniref:DUF302 domain-containing protein n=1 Tax=Candidatus Venteria ishoeyi TaxID=1899563 RepID=A0A1H6FA72_9GAMM|nr:DUF302 domain-containing protein [Candidatus Venteria ishoeyi]MDM8547497.1 DUF302 domain-containing protein [Candidatus Venteria ishoeyi]SEH05905.1 Uncharacterised protein [Candidatus Venteria ishoeyi]